MVSKTPLFVAIILAVSLAGCSDGDGLRGETIIVKHGQVPADTDGRGFVRNVVCLERALVDIEAEPFAEGSITVLLKDGGAYTVKAINVRAGDELPVHEEAVGGAGTWTLEVRRTAFMGDPFTVTFRC